MEKPNVSVGRSTNLVNNTYERYDYDQGERLTSIAGGELDADGNDGQESYRISYGYDNFNRLNSKTYNIGDESRKTEYTYENSDSTSGSTKSRLTKITLPNNSEINYSYDNLNRSTSRTHTKQSKQHSQCSGELYFPLQRAHQSNQIKHA